LNLDFVAPDLDFVASGLDFVVSNLDFVAADLEILHRASAWPSGLGWMPSADKERSSSGAAVGEPV
jgi:hypothetical protein